MTETQETISQWSIETFGDAGSNFRVAIRAQEEMTELLVAISTHEPQEDIIEEAADVAIVIYRLASRLGITISPYWMSDREGLQLKTIASRANKRLADIIVLLSMQDNDMWRTYSLQELMHFLRSLCTSLGSNLSDAVSTKMAINRGRKWRKDKAWKKSGSSYHIEETT